MSGAPEDQRPAIRARGLDLEVQPGEMLAVTGPSGSGKSTLLYALSGLIGLDAGVVEIAGRIPARPADWTRMRSGPLGLVFQDPWLLPTLTAAQNVELPMIGVEPSARVRAERVSEAMALAGIPDRGAQSPASLSGGESQRIAIARALVNHPRVILADEPTGELDSENSARILALLADLVRQQGVTVVIVTHDAGIAEACDREYRIIDGRGAFVRGRGEAAG